jgi:hypothetical protein
VSRKGGKSHKRPAKRDETQNADAATVSVLPMELQVGDRLIDQDLEWEVLTRPAVLHGAKSLRARVSRPGQQATERDVTWPAHVRVEIRRGPARDESPTDLLPRVRVLFLIRSITSTTWGHEAWPLVKPLLRQAL